MATICSANICSVIDSPAPEETLSSLKRRVGPSLTSVRVRPVSVSPVSGFLRRVADWLERRREQRESRDAFAHLLALDDSLLDDIGVTRAEVMRAARLPLSEDAATSLYTSALGTDASR